MKGHVYKKEDLEAVFKRYIEDFKLTDQQFEKLKVEIGKKLQSSETNAEKEIDKANKNIKLLKEKQSTLIAKNISGVINDEILKEQLEFIKAEIDMTSASLVQPVTVSKVEFDTAINIASQYLKRPSYAWEKAPLHTKLKLQWFNFPFGISFDGGDCATTEIANIYKCFCGNSPLISRVVTPPGIEPGLTA